MMTTILLCVLLLLGIVWLTLGIAYSYERWRSLSRQRIGQRQEPQQREEEAADQGKWQGGGRAGRLDDG